MAGLKDFDRWLELDVLNGKTCTYLTHRELELMQIAYYTGRQVQKRTVLLPMDKCKEIRDTAKPDYEWNRPRIVTTKGTATCRQCGLKIKYKTQAIKHFVPLLKMRDQFKNKIFLHLEDCGTPLREMEKYENT